ncbi:unnamed protein product, partial [Laminaria digitata]
RTQAYDLPVEVGLISFGSKVTVTCQPTPLLEDFRDQANVLTNSGDTRLWDALEAAYTLIKAGSEEELPILRILVLSDGKDTKSDASAHV